MKNFTPVFDNIVAEYGLIPAAVYGAIWRFAQQKDGMCRASAQKIGTKCGVSHATVKRAIKSLSRGGAIVDLTPEKRNGPHHYKCPVSKTLVGQSDLPGGSERPTKVGQRDLPGGSERPTKVGQSDLPGGSERPTKVGQSDLQRYNRRDNVRNKKKIQVEDTENLLQESDPLFELDENLKICITLYRNNIGTLGPMQMEDFKDIYGGLSPPPFETKQLWFEYAVLEAASKNANNWSYVKAILQKVNQAGSLNQHKENRNGQGISGSARGPQGGQEASASSAEEYSRNNDDNIRDFEKNFFN